MPGPTPGQYDGRYRKVVGEYDENPILPSDLKSHQDQVDADLLAHHVNFHGAPVIIDGGDVNLIVATDTVTVDAVIAADVNGQPLVTASFSPLTLVNTTGGMNYVVVRLLDIDGYNPGGDAGDFDRRVTKGYEVLCRNTKADLVAGDVKLMKAYKSGGTWYFLTDDSIDSEAGREPNDKSGVGAEVPAKVSGLTLVADYADTLVTGVLTASKAKTIESKGGLVKVSWTGLTGDVDEYQVWWKLLDGASISGGTSVVVANTARLQSVPADEVATLIETVAGSEVRVKVRGLNRSGYGAWSDTGDVITGLGSDAAPVISSLVLTPGKDGIAVSFTGDADCTRYEMVWKAGGTPNWAADKVMRSPSPQFRIPLESVEASPDTIYIKVRGVDKAERWSNELTDSDAVTLRDTLTADDRKRLNVIVAVDDDVSLDPRVLGQLADVNAIRVGLSGKPVPKILERMGPLAFSESIGAGTNPDTVELFRFKATKKMSLRALQVNLSSPIGYSGSGTFTPANERIIVYSVAGEPPAGDEIRVPIDDVAGVYDSGSLRSDSLAKIINVGDTVIVAFVYAGPSGAFTVAGQWMLDFYAE